MRTSVRVLLFCLASLTAGTLRADLDVGIPPGMPLEWRFELPFHQLDPYRGPVYTKGPAREAEEKAAAPSRRGRTVVYQPKVVVKPPARPPRFGGFNPMGAARILTLDMARELPWTSWDREDSLPEDLGYPPRTRVDLHWLCISALLRPVMHPAKISHAETAHYLITIGAPVLDSIENGYPVNPQLVEYLRRNIPPIPPRPPDAARLKAGVESAEERMLVEWASRELVSDHPYAYNPLYARRTLSLGGEAVPVLISCARSRHALLRQNACGILAAYDSYDEAVVDALRTLARGPDPVARNRALEALVGLRDRETEELLIKALRGSDQRFRVYAIAALGRTGSLAARSAIHRVLRAGTRDHGDTWLTAAVALSRLPDADGASRALLKRLKVTVGRLGNRLRYPAGGVSPDLPDKPGDRARLIRQAITLAMARLGDEEARGDVLDELEVRPDPLRPPRARERFEDPVLGGIEPVNQLLAVETLAAMGDDDARGVLRRVVEESPDIVLRGYALAHLSQRARNEDFVRAQAQSTSRPTVLRVAAMEALARADSELDAALAVAEAMVDEYLPLKEARSLRRGADRVPSYGCLAAVKLLGRHRPLAFERLREVSRKAKERGDYERLESAPRTPGPGRSNQVSLRAFPALYEAVIVELGKLRDIRAVELLAPVLADAATAPGRAEAALALGNFPTRETCDLLIETLSDDDPWVRYCAYRALRQMSGVDHFADWLFGSASERASAVASWDAWRRGERGAALPPARELIAAKEAEEARKREEEARKKKEEADKAQAETKRKRRRFPE